MTAVNVERAKALVVASLEGNVRGVQAILLQETACTSCWFWNRRRRGIDVDVPRDEDGTTPLLAASYSGSLAIVRLLLEYGASVHQNNRTHNDGASPLFMAAQGGHLQVLNLLLAQGAVVDQPLNNGPTPLFVAAQNGHLSSVQALLSHNAGVDLAHENGATPLFVASQNGHLEIVKTLLAHGATSIHKRSVEGTTPLFMASQGGHAQVVATLLQHGADPNLPRDDNVTPLSVAVQTRSWSVLPVLLQGGATVDDAYRRLCTCYTSAVNWMANQGGSLGQLQTLPEDSDIRLNWDLLVTLLWTFVHGTAEGAPVLKQTRELVDDDAFRKAYQWMIHAACRLIHIDTRLLEHFCRVYPPSVALERHHDGHTPLGTALQLYPQHRHQENVSKGIEYLIQWNSQVLKQSDANHAVPLATAIQRGAPLSTLLAMYEGWPASARIKHVETGLALYLLVAATPRYYQPTDVYSLSRNILPHILTVARKEEPPKQPVLKTNNSTNEKQSSPQDKSCSLSDIEVVACTEIVKV